MRNHRHHISQNLITRDRGKGFSLTELMIAMTIGMLLMVAISSLLVSTKKSYGTQNAMARMQENGRIALQLVSRDVRNAGYFGCSNGINGPIRNNLNTPTDTGAWSNTVPLQGNDGGIAVVYPGSDAAPAGTPDANYPSDVIGIRYTDGATDLPIAEPFMPQPSAAVHLPPGNGLRVGDVVMLSDCSGGDIFTITGPSDPDSTGTLNHNSGTTGGVENTTQSLSRVYGADAKIIKFVSRYYFVKTNASGQPALYWQLPNADPVTGLPIQEELVEGIERLELLYGVDTDGDGIPDRYVKAGDPTYLVSKTHWKTVRTVRIGILARSYANHTGNAARTSAHAAHELDSNQYDVDGDGAIDVDAATLTTEQRGYFRRVFRTTIWLRNRHG